MVYRWQSIYLEIRLNPFFPPPRWAKYFVYIGGSLGTCQLPSGCSGNKIIYALPVQITHRSRNPKITIRPLPCVAKYAVVKDVHRRIHHRPAVSRERSIDNKTKLGDGRRRDTSALAEHWCAAHSFVATTVVPRLLIYDVTFLPFTAPKWWIGDWMRGWETNGRFSDAYDVLISQQSYASNRFYIFRIQEMRSVGKSDAH